MNGTASMSPVSATLPQTDEERLLFYSEVLMANVPTLIADLSSAKYALLSFSGKTREEVKQKQSLIQSLGRSVTSVITTKRSLQAAKKTLDEYETKLVSAAPPKFVTSSEALHLSSSNEPATTTTAGGDTHNHAGNNGAVANSTADPNNASSSSESLMILSEEDIQPVRAAEEAYEKECAIFSDVSKACNEMEDAFEKAREQCQVMTEHVQRLKWKYDAVFKAWKSTARERKMVAVMQAEQAERQAIITDALWEGKALEEECSAQELRIIEDTITKAEAESAAIAEELKAKKDRYEVELATYQIAYKEEQSTVELLRDQCKHLQAHLLELEMLAKRQQLEETDRNSLRKLMVETLTLSPSRRASAAERILTAEQQAAVMADHPLVSLLAARIAILQEQRNTIGGILIGARGLGKSEDVTNAIERIQALLEPEIQVDEAAIASS